MHPRRHRSADTLFTKERDISSTFNNLPPRTSLKAKLGDIKNQAVNAFNDIIESHEAGKKAANMNDTQHYPMTRPGRLFIENVSHFHAWYRCEPNINKGLASLSLTPGPKITISHIPSTMTNTYQLTDALRLHSLHMKQDGTEQKSYPAHFLKFRRRIQQLS